MAATQVSVLLAVREMVHSASVAQALMQAGAAVSLLEMRSSEHLLEQIAERHPELLVLKLDEGRGVLEQVRTRHPQLAVVALSSKPTAEMAFAVSRLGVEDLWTLPPDAASIVQRFKVLLNRLQPASGKAGHLIGAVSATPQAPVMVGTNPRMEEIRDTIEKVAETDVTVLIRGESGVGKEIVARLLFEHSRRKQKPFVKLNCAAIPHDLLESELFGYEAGAFTGATRDKPGKFEMADHGTLFLDEIAEMHPMLQAKLLHVLQDGRFSRLGAKRDVSVDVRVICATNKSLEERVREGLFREDVLYRINVVTIFVPPLRERRDEIPVLTEYLLGKYAAQYGRALHSFSPEVTQRMMEYDWPGNIRELENLCKRFVIVGGETQILRELSERSRMKPALAKVAHEPMVATAPNGDAKDSQAPTLSLLEVGRRAAWEAERRAILEMLEVTRWNRREAARRLQVSYKALLNKIKQMQLEDKTAEAGSKSRKNISTQ